MLVFAAIAFNALQEGDLERDVMLFASYFAGVFFLNVSFFGMYRWEKTKVDESDR